MSKSRPQQWQEACADARTALEAISAAKTDLEAAFSTLLDLQGEYESWRDNLPESLTSSPVAEKLDAVMQLDLEPDIDDTSACESALDEAEGADLPRGFGND
jgi:hypothetical protein